MVFVLLLVWMLAGCSDEISYIDESKTPGASGSIDLAPGVSPSAYSWLTVELADPDDERRQRNDVELGLLGTIEWPVHFGVGYSYGDTGETGDYRLRAWLANAKGEPDPAPDAPRTETTVHVDCVGNSWCLVTDVALVLAN